MKRSTFVRGRISEPLSTSTSSAIGVRARRPTTHRSPLVPIVQVPIHYKPPSIHDIASHPRRSAEYVHGTH